MGSQNGCVNADEYGDIPTRKTVVLKTGSRFHRGKEGTNSTESLRRKQSGFW